MQGREIVKTILDEQGVSYAELGRRVGASLVNVRQRILRPGEEKPKDLSVDTLRKYLDALGYEIVIREKGKKKGKEYIVTDGEEQ